MRSIILSLIFLKGVLSLSAQCSEISPNFKIGEEISYKAYYNWGFIWVHAGYAHFNVHDTTINNKSFYLFKSQGYSHEGYDWFFKVRDYFSSVVTKKDLKPIYFYRDNLEGDYWVKNQYVFNHSEKLIYSNTQNSKKPLTKDTLKLKPCVNDVLTAIYYTRAIDFNKVKIDQTIPLDLIVDGEIYNLHIRYLGKETIEAEELSKSFNCIKFSVLLIDGTIFKGGEDMTVWVTDDSNKIPVYIEAKILIGSVKAYLTSYKNLAFPINVSE